MADFSVVANSPTCPCQIGLASGFGEGIKVGVSLSTPLTLLHRDFVRSRQLLLLNDALF